MGEDAIINLPRQINKLRNIDKYYDVSEAKVILKDLKLLSSNYELSEECISSSNVFLDAGRTELLNASSLKLHQFETGIGVGPYMCSLHVFTVRKHADALPLVNTHPVSEEVDGNCNGILLITLDSSLRSCKLLSQWILKQPQTSGISSKELQSLAWLRPITGKRKEMFSSSTSGVMMTKEHFFFSEMEENLQTKRKMNKEMIKDAGKGIEVTGTK